MKRKGAGQKGFLLVVLATFISTSVFGEGKNVDGSTKAGARIVFFNAEFSDSDSYAQETHSIESTKPPLAMTTALKFDELLGAYLRLSMPSEKGVSPYVATYLVTSVTRASQWTRSDIEAAAGNESHSDGDVSYGIGAEFHLAEDAKINVEYRDYINSSKVETPGFSFGASWTF